VVATIGFQSAGQSHESMVTQIVCEELGVRPAEVAVNRADSLAGIVGSAAMGSRMTLMLGTALVQAAAKVRAKLRRIAAHVLEVGPEDIVVDGSRYYVAGAAHRALELSELAAIAYRQAELLPEGEELGLVDGAVFVGFGAGKHVKDGRLQYGFPSYAFSVHLLMVVIDPDTFKVEIKRYLVVHDCGQVINPLAVNGLLFGGIAHGIGGALLEQWVYDQNGQMLNPNFMDYLMPTASEVPRIELHEQVTPSPLHPYGSKGTAEGGYLTAPAAIASAVEDALAPLGVEIDELPMSPSLLARLSRQGAAALDQPTWETNLLAQRVGGS
jgi:CO/xanthine dehydrogenase Mo-binding subunit